MQNHDFEGRIYDRREVIIGPLVSGAAAEFVDLTTSEYNAVVQVVCQQINAKENPEVSAAEITELVQEQASKYRAVSRG